MRKFLSILTALLLITLLPITVLAEDKGVAVNIQVDPTQMNVIVPSTMPFVFNANGTNQYPDNFTIENKSTISNIYLSEVKMNGSIYSWKLLTDSYVIKDLAVNEKAIKFKMGLVNGQLRTIAPNNDKEATGSATWTQGEFTIPAGESRTLAFEIERGSFTETIAPATAYNMVMTYNFCS